MKLSILPLLCLTLAGVGPAHGQEGMTVKLFKQIVETLGDSTPLSPKLAPVPFWSTAVCSNYMKYQDGRVFTEEVFGAAKTIKGRYIVFTMDSRYYKQPMHSILSYDERAQAYKQWGLFETNLTEATLVFDFVKRVSAWTGRYDPGFMEISVGTFSEKESSEHSLSYKDGVLFLTRDSKVRPAAQSAAEPGGAANRSQSVRPETNQPSAAAGSGR